MDHERKRGCGTLPKPKRHPSFKDESGNKYGKLLVIKYSHKTNAGNAAWICICECGEISTVTGVNLRSGNTTSCGKCGNITHGNSRRGKKTDEYNIWNKMLNRCHNVNATRYEAYGGRGIYVCDEWRRSFAAFLADMGKRPTKSHTIERIDNDGPYCADNCKWATMSEQSKNKRNNVNVTIDGKTQCLSDWLRELGIGESTIRYRVNVVGMSHAQALSLRPVRGTNNLSVFVSHKKE